MMNNKIDNILIINLRRLGDVFSTGHLAESLKSRFPSSKITLLTYAESAEAARALIHIDFVQSIDRKEIITLKVNPLFSDPISFEKLFNDLKPLRSQQWDQIINYSNDFVATCLTSYLKSNDTKNIGLSLGSNKELEHSSDWALYFNNVLPSLQYAPLNFVNCYHEMTGVKQVSHENKIKTIHEYDLVTEENFNLIRDQHSQKSATAKLVGIQLKSADLEKELKSQVIVSLIKEIQSSNEFIPVLLTAPIAAEKVAAEHINSQLEDEITVIEADLKAIHSVISQLDIIITPDTAIKHIADLLNKPVIEISLGPAPFLKQGSIRKNSFILTDIISKRSFKKSSSAQQNSKISSSDIYSTLIGYFYTGALDSIKLSSGVTLYQVQEDDLGVFYKAIAGDVDHKIELQRALNRIISYRVLNKSTDSINTSLVGKSEKLNKNMSSLIQDEKLFLTEVTKSLLGTLRALISGKENTQVMKEFVAGLGKLLNFSTQTHFTQIPLLLFKEKIELIRTGNFKQNTQEVEILLYELKSDLQTVLDTLKELEGLAPIEKSPKSISPARGTL